MSVTTSSFIYDFAPAWSTHIDEGKTTIHIPPMGNHCLLSASSTVYCSASNTMMVKREPHIPFFSLCDDTTPTSGSRWQHYWSPLSIRFHIHHLCTVLTFFTFAPVKGKQNRVHVSGRCERIYGLSFIFPGLLSPISWTFLNCERFHSGQWINLMAFDDFFICWCE